MLPITYAYLTHPTSRPWLRDPVAYSLRAINAVAVHWTANTDKGANAMANRNYFNLGSRYASAHYCVDDHSIVACLPDREVGYHVGDRPGGRYKPAGLEIMGKRARSLTPNYFCVGVEMCVNSDGNYGWTYKHTVDLVAHLLVKHGLTTAKGLLRHYDITGKACPRPLLDESTWLLFKADVVAARTQLEALHPRRAITTIGDLNVRAGAGVQHKPLGALPKGEAVLVMEQTTYWARIGHGQWVSLRYLADVQGTV